MHRLLSLVLLTQLFVYVGCSQSPEIPIPPTSGDFVKSEDGVGTAKVFGIDFQVAVSAGGASTEDEIHADFLEPEKSGASKRFTLGDEAVIQLDSINESEVEFVYNDQDYGTLKVGDQVVIDAEGNVTVNGTERMPTAE